MKDLIEKLKRHLRSKQGAYAPVHEWCGDTEDGFHTEIHFDIDDLMREIDAFAASFEKGNKK